MTTLFYVIYILMFYSLLHFVDVEFEFVDIPTDISTQDIIVSTVTTIALTINVMLMGMLLIKSTLL